MSERISRQGRQVLAALSSERVHLTADEIVRKLPDIGQATVYRNLDQLERMGQIKRLNLGQRSAYYEYVRDNHIHFVCDRCHEVYDVSCDVTGLVREVNALSGHRTDRVEVTSSGLCAECMKQEKKEQQ
ncbi:transcriptional repressor [Beduinella massiliensis]|uniref:transcriptional repressor n=1 Tax=Beduinella massiliensis TaxID=1852363 RepID=UPI000C82043A